MNEISIVPQEKLKNLIKTVWQKVADKAGHVKQPDIPEVPSLKQSELPFFDPKGEYKPHKPSKKSISKPTQLPLPMHVSTRKPKKGEKMPSLKSLVKPKTKDTLFGQRYDMTKPPFYNSVHEWKSDNFFGTRYKGPDLSQYGFSIGFARVSPGDNIPVARINLEMAMENWNKALARKFKRESSGRN